MPASSARSRGRAGTSHRPDPAKGAAISMPRSLRVSVSRLDRGRDALGQVVRGRLHGHRGRRPWRHRRWSGAAAAWTTAFGAGFRISLSRPAWRPAISAVGRQGLGQVPADSEPLGLLFGLGARIARDHDDRDLGLGRPHLADDVFSPSIPPGNFRSIKHQIRGGPHWKRAMASGPSSALFTRYPASESVRPKLFRTISSSSTIRTLLSHSDHFSTSFLGIAVLAGQGLAHGGSDLVWF